MELFKLILDNVNNNGKHDPKKFIGFSYLHADGDETRTDRICTFYKNDNGEINVLYARIDPITKKLVNCDDEDDIKSPDMSSPKYRLDYEQLEYFKTNMPFYIGENERCSDPIRLNSFCGMINDREKQREWINRQLRDRSLSVSQKKECMKDFLKFNYLLIREDEDEKNGEITYSELKHLVDTELDTKLFSASHKRSDKHYSEIVIQKPSENSELTDGEAGVTLNKYLKGSDNKILLNAKDRAQKAKKGTVLEKTKTLDNDVLKHELGHFKFAMIISEIIENLEKSDSYANMQNNSKKIIARQINLLIGNRLKKYVRTLSLKRYNEAAKLAGQSNAEEGKTYNKYDGANEVSKKLLMGHSAYSRVDSEEYLAETESADNYEHAILDELFHEIFDNDFSKINQESVNKFLNKIEIKAIDLNEVVNIARRNKALYNFINYKSDDGKTYSTNLSNKVNLASKFLYKLTEDNSNQIEGIKKIAKYTILLKALENVADGANSTSDDEQCKKELKENLEKEFNNFDFEKIKQKFDNVDIKDIKTKVLTSINKYKDRIEKIDNFKDRLLYYNNEHIINRKPVSIDTLNHIFNYYEHFDENENYEDQRFVLMNKFKSKKPYFNSLIKKLKSKTESNETIKKILKEELHDIQDAYLFYSLLGKKLDDFVNPFNMEIPTKKNFVDETRDELNRMINTIDLDSNDLEKASRIENKNFYELFSEYKTINQNQNVNQNVSTLASRLEIEKAKLRINNKNDKVSSLNKSSEQEDEKSEKIITIRKNRKKVGIRSDKSSKQEDAKQENINTIKMYKKNAGTSLKIPNEQMDKKSEEIITIRKSKKKTNMSSNGNVEVEKQSHGDKSEEQGKLNITTLKNAVRKKNNDRKINQVVPNGNNNVDNSNRQNDSGNKEQIKFDNFDALNMLRIYKLLDVALEKIQLPDNAKPQIIIPTGPMYVIGQDKKIGFPNIIIKVGQNDAYYLSNEGIISSNATWRLLNHNFDKLLEDKISMNDERRTERVKDYGKLESRDGVGIINLNGKDEIQQFKTDLNNAINTSKQILERLATESNIREYILANNQFRKKEEEFNNSESNKILTELRKGIDYKFEEENYENRNATKKPFISFDRIRDLMKCSKIINKDNRQEEARSAIRINEISNNRRKSENVPRNRTTLKRLGVRQERDSVCACGCMK